LEKLRVLSIGEEMPAPLRRALEEVAAQPFVQSVLALPDVHWKENMEVPSSIAITTRDTVVPEFTSMDVNDGMGIVKTGLRAEDMSAERLAAFFTRINSHGAAGRFDMNRYSISAEELRRTLTEGARAVLQRYELDSIEASEHDLLHGVALAAADLPTRETYAAPPGAYTCC
jgi:tRNA-splicing ligase RtcB